MKWIVLVSLMISILGSISEAPAAPSTGNNASGNYVCVARLFCPNSVDASLQELPSDDEATAVKASTEQEARASCLTSFTSAYRSLQKRAPAGCLIQSEALQNLRSQR